MPEHPATSSTCVPPIILHGRRLRLSHTQARLLAVLLARSGQFVADCDLPVQGDNPLWLQISRIRSVVAPHGLLIYRVRCHGFVLLAREETGS